MDFPKLRPAPPAKRLVEVQHRDVREVGNPRDHLQEPETLDGPLVEERVQEQAPHIIQLARHGMRVDAAARRLAFPLGFRDGLVRQHQTQRRGHGARVPLLEPDCLPDLPENRRALLEKVRLRQLPGRRGPVSIKIVGLLDVVRHRCGRLGRRYGVGVRELGLLRVDELRNRVAVVVRGAARQCMATGRHDECRRGRDGGCSAETSHGGQLSVYVRGRRSGCTWTHWCCGSSRAGQYVQIRNVAGVFEVNNAP